MRWRILLALSVTCLCATSALSATHGRNLWRIEVPIGATGRWQFLDAGTVQTSDARVPVVLLGLARTDRPEGRYYEMKVVDGRDGTTLWTYDGTGSDYVYAGTRGHGGESADRFAPAPTLADVDGDASDDVVFLEESFIYNTVLRAVRIEP